MKLHTTCHPEFISGSLIPKRVRNDAKGIGYIIIKVTFLVFVLLIAFPNLLLAKAQSKSKVVSKVGDLEVRVESDQPGEVDLRVENGEVEIRVSKGLTPTIFISDKKITPTIIEIAPQEEKEMEQKEYSQERKTVLNWIKNLFSSILNFLFRQ